MTSELVADSRQVNGAEVVDLPAPKRFKTVRTVFAFAWKVLVGALLCQGPLSSILVVGWMLRLMQYQVWRHWWRVSDLQHQDVTFESFMAQDEQTRTHLHWPNWVLGSAPIPAGAPCSKMRIFSRRLVGSLYDNAKLGLQGMLNTWALTLPGCGLWLSAWFAGWNNSFHKGYELAWVGPTTGVIGVVLFITAMLYVPLAQARQAVTGQWRTFYDFALIWRLIRKHWRWSIVLSGLYSLLSLPVIALLTLPAFFEHIWPHTTTLSDAEALDFLKTYYFRVGLLGFAVVVALRWLAARFYATAVMAAVQTGSIRVEELSAIEQLAFQCLNLQTDSPPLHRAFIIRTPLWMGSRLIEGFAVGMTVALWFTFVAQIFVSEFFNYHPIAGWLNQPLVQLPWFGLIPPGLK